MPNIKLFLDEAHWDAAAPPLREGLPALCAMVCATLQAERSACQLALVRVAAPDGQPALNAELHVMPAAARTREVFEELARQIRQWVSEQAGVTSAVRIALLDPETYVALK